MIINKDKLGSFFAKGQPGYTWWTNLVGDDEKDPIWRGERAELRRAKELSEVLVTSGYFRLRRRIVEAGVGREESSLESRRDDIKLAAIAGALAHVKSDSSQRNFGKLLAYSDDGGKAPVSGLRFRRLLERKEIDDLYPHLLRVLKLVDSAAPVQVLAKDLFEWERDERIGEWERDECIRQKWADGYYITAPDED